MTVLDYTETPFARLPRLHHKDALVGPASAGFARRNLVGLMGVMMAETSGNAEEEMYKELFIQLMADTLPSVVTIPADVAAFGRNYAIMSTKVEDLTIEFNPSTWGNNTAAQNFVYNCSKLKYLRLPNARLIGYPSIVGGAINNLTDLYIPNVTRFDNATLTFYNYNGTHLNVHCGTKTCEQIKAITNFPGTNNATIMGKLTFVGSDGSLNYSGGEWVQS